MLPDYDDIFKAAGCGIESVYWWDQHGVPRFAPFHPMMLGVYDRFAILAEIECQSCSRHLIVGYGTPQYTFFGSLFTYTIEEICTDFRYGDPPRHDCVGDTMSSFPVAILEAWDHDDTLSWRRRFELEGAIK